MSLWGCGKALLLLAIFFVSIFCIKVNTKEQLVVMRLFVNQMRVTPFADGSKS